MDQEKGNEKKVSIGDALDAIRSGRNLPAEAKSNSGPKLPAASNFEYQRVSPAYWLDNLQEGVQRSRDQLFDSIAKDSKNSNGMARRDLHASESFFVPSEWMDEVDLTKPVQEVGLGRSTPEEITIGGPTMGSGTETSSDIQTEGVRFNSTENLNVQALQVEEVESEDSGEPKMRINPMIREIFKKKAES